MTRSAAGAPRPAGRGAPTRADTEKRLKRLAWLLDSSIPLPGGYRVGLDGVIGLIPGFGDAAGALISSYIVVEAARIGAPKSLLLRMAFNIMLETVVGAVPLFGDLFDFAYKANLRNVRLLEQRMSEPARGRISDRAVAGGIVLALLGALVVAIAGAFAIVALIWRALAPSG